MELEKNYIIKTSIGFFCKEASNLITTDITRATQMDKIRINTYFQSICNDIALKNLQEIKAEMMIYNGFRFEIGKYYENVDGFKVHILGVHHLTVYGKSLVAETNAEVPLLPLGLTEEATIGFKEITKERWMEDFKPISTEVK